uniref:CFA20 domain-containing protein n=3 Tax=Oryza TaxID=4527 RepID=A0A0E0ETQ0_9ORYZ
MSYQKVPPPQDGYPPPGNSPLPSSPGSIPPRVRLVWLLAGPGRSDGGGRGFLDLNLTLFRIPILFWVDLDACPKSESGTAQHRPYPPPPSGGQYPPTQYYPPPNQPPPGYQGYFSEGQQPPYYYPPSHDPHHHHGHHHHHEDHHHHGHHHHGHHDDDCCLGFLRGCWYLLDDHVKSPNNSINTMQLAMAKLGPKKALPCSPGWPFFAAAACWRNVAAAAADGLNALKLLHLEDRPAAPLPENPTPTSPPPPPAPPPAAAAAAASISGSPPPLPLPPPPRVGQFLLAVDELPPDRGTKPLQIWDKEVVDGHIKRPQDEDIQSNVLEIIGTNVQSTYITCPADPAATLGIKLPFLALIVKNLKKYFTFEIQVLDDKNVRRRFRASNFQSVTRVKPYICTMPLKLEDGWNNIQLNLSDLTKRAYGTNYVETLRVQVHANCRLRRIYFADRLYSEEELPPEFKLYLPIQKA